MYHDGASKPCKRLGEAPMQSEKLGGRREVERGTDSKGFVSHVSAGGSGIFPNRELLMVDLCFRNHSDCIVENG